MTVNDFTTTMGVLFTSQNKEKGKDKSKQMFPV